MYKSENGRRPAMKVLFIGGTGRISMAITKQLMEHGDDLYLLNRGNKNSELSGKVHEIRADINDEVKVAQLLKEHNFDVVVDFIAFDLAQVERDYRLFQGKTNQYIYISSASAYHKPPKDYLITEGTSLGNPFWEYSRNKITCEEYLMKQYRECGFPVTIVRPSHTYDEKSIPVGVHGGKSWQVAKRMLEGKPVIIHGDGTSLWTLTHNTDFAKGFIGLMGNAHAIGEAIQITSDETLTWNQIYEMIASALGVKLYAVHIASEMIDACSTIDFRGSLIGDKANSVVFDNSKLKRLVPGFTANKRFDQGIKETIEYIKSHPECQVEDKEFDNWCDKMIQGMEQFITHFNTKE